ncbi:MAG: DUF4338 domain-containing protein [Hyphomicrobiales bacterium]|nr:DUF4338 domain-containing protein [Hyphomicrobiales bacterium]
MMTETKLKFCGTPVTGEELALIKEMAEEFWGISRTELAETLCELLEWKRPNGRLKGVECRQFLEELESRSVIRLPKPRRGKPKGTHAKAGRSAQGEALEPIQGSVKDIGPVILVRAETRQDRELWKELIDRYHYLGFKTPFGASLRYLIRTLGAEPQTLGCLQFSSPAWSLEPRDEWIGWDATTRKARLQLIVQNSRFLLLPWVEVKRLASHVLSKASKQLPLDWELAFKRRPVLLETFVDQARFSGTCYRAANWIHVGETKGRGRMDRQKHHQEPVRSIWVYPLARKFRAALLGES